MSFFFELIWNFFVLKLYCNNLLVVIIIGLVGDWMEERNVGYNLMEFLVCELCYMIFVVIG